MNNTFDEKTVKVDAGKLKLAKDDLVDYEPICVFSENKPRRAFLRGTRKIVLLVDGHTQALRFGKAGSELQPFWTKKEASTFVKKEIAKAHSELKPIKTWQFIVIIAFLAVIFLYLLKLGGTLRF